jgi:hypothetical protein
MNLFDAIHGLVIDKLLQGDDPRFMLTELICALELEMSCDPENIALQRLHDFAMNNSRTYDSNSLKVTT